MWPRRTHAETAWNVGRASGENGLQVRQNVAQNKRTSLTDVEDPLPGMRHRRSSRTSSGESATWTYGQGVSDEEEAAEDDDDSGCGKVNMLRKTVEQLAKIPL